MLIPAVPGESIPLVFVPPDGRAGLFPLATVFDLDGNPVGASIPLSFNVLGGYYLAQWSVPEAAKYTVVYVIFGDAGHTADLSSEPGLARTMDLIASNFAGTAGPLVASGLDPFR